MSAVVRGMGSDVDWTKGFIAVDWGTTNRRAYRLDAEGKNADEFEDGKGVLSVPAGGFPEAVKEIRDRLGDLPLLLAGMVGSNRGWKEAPYVPCPAGIDDLVQHLVWVGEREAIVPGVSYIGDGRADVMRGEEVQLLGAVANGSVDPMGMVCHPGTHNKWAMLRQRQDRRIPDGDDRASCSACSRTTASSPTFCRGRLRPTTLSSRQRTPRSTTRHSPPTCSRFALECCSARRRRKTPHPTPAGC